MTGISKTPYVRTLLRSRLIIRVICHRVWGIILLGFAGFGKHGGFSEFRKAAID